MTIRRVLLVPVPVCAALLLFSNTSHAQAPAVTGYAITASTDIVLDGGADIGLHSDDGVQSIALPFPIALYNRIFTSVSIGANGNIQFASNNQLAVNGALPRLGFGPAIFAYWDDLRTDGTDAAGQPFGIFTQVTGDAPNRIFHVRWHAQYFAAGGGGGNADFEVLLYESGARFDVIYAAGGTAGSATVGVQAIDVGPATQYSSNVSITALAGVRLTFTGTGATEMLFSTNYVISEGVGTVLDGGTDTTNHSDDGVTPVHLPFPVTFYDQTFESARVGANGTFQFGSSRTDFNNAALPAANFLSTIFPYWDDLRTDGGSRGIFTQTTGDQPNRIFHIRWDAAYRGPGVGAPTGAAQFELLLHEESTTFDVIYGPGTAPVAGVGATIGVQQKTFGLFTQYSSRASIVSLAGTKLTFTLGEPNTPPDADAGADQTLEATGSAGTLFTLDGTASSDAEGALDFDWSGPFGTATGPSPDVRLAAPPAGQQSVTHTATLTVTDEGSERDNDTVELTVTDTTGPEIFGSPGDFSLEGDQIGGAHVDFGPLSAIDVVDGDQPVTCSHSPGVFALGTSVVSCSSSDLHTNSSHVRFHVTVADTTSPVLTLPGPMTVHATGPNGAGVAFVATAADVVSGVLAVNCRPSAGSTFPLGTTRVNCDATDGSGNSAAGAFTVTVTNTAPMCSGTPSVSLVWPPDQRMVPVGIHGVSDPDGDPFTLKVTDVRQDEPTNGRGDGNTPVDATGVGTPAVQIRAERAGTGNGRVYHIFYSATDHVGASCRGEVTVGVPHDQGKGSVPVDGGPIFSSLLP
jgi:hypothetical protein